MRIAYIFSSLYWNNDGITQKVRNQIRFWNSLGMEAKGFCQAPANRFFETYDEFDVIPAKKVGVSFIDQSRVLAKFIPSSRFIEQVRLYDPEMIYMRYEPMKPYIWGLRSLSKSIPVVLELNSLDRNEALALSKKSLGGKFYFLFNEIFRRYTFHLASGAVGVCDDILSQKNIASMGLPLMTVPNSIPLDKISRLKSKSDSVIPNVLFMISQAFDWQGVDKLQKLIKETDGKLKFTLIGNFEPYDFSQYPNVDCYGFITGEKLERVVSRCHVALAGLALHRAGLNEACTLKVRDYLAWGLPIILPHIDTALKHVTPDWLLSLPNCENNIADHIDEIIDFCYQNINTIVPRQEVVNLIDAQSLEKKRVSFLKSIKPLSSTLAEMGKASVSSS